MSEQFEQTFKWSIDFSKLKAAAQKVRDLEEKNEEAKAEVYGRAVTRGDEDKVTA